ncbi:MAG TPA: DUF2804 family protein [Pyrinomonadaceae bacterium]|nr:DUF2804 family protein [Pyrinomonadaceae bacterium]
MPSSINEPYRGSGVDRPRDVPLPPQRMPFLRAGQLRKRWHYVSFWSRELSFCAARVSIGPLTQEYWGIWDREANQFREGSHRFTNRVHFEANRIQVWDEDTEIAVSFPACTSFEVYRPADQAYIWSHKDYCRNARGSVRYAGRKVSVVGVIFVDINAGYHERHTKWRWAAGAGIDQQNRLVAFNAITGLFDTPSQSERTVWIEGDAQEIGPNTFAEDLSSVSFDDGSSLQFKPEALIEQHENLLFVRSDYFHWFGTYTGTLPGGIELREAYGVRERHHALW